MREGEEGKKKAKGREVYVKFIDRLEESFVCRVLSPWGTFVLQNGVPHDTPDPSLVAHGWRLIYSFVPFYPAVTRTVLSGHPL